MNVEWQQFLGSRGAVLAEGRVAHFGDPAAELRAAAGATVLCDLSHRGVVRARGADVREFLHGQLSNDIEHLEPGQSRLAAYNSPKGRMYAVLRLLWLDDALLLVLPRDSLGFVLGRLRMFVLRAAVELEDAGDAIVGLGLAGPQAPDLLREALGEAPAQIDDAVQAGGAVAARIAGPGPRYEIWGTRAAMESLWAALSAAAVPAGEDAWGLLDIRAGLPVVHAATREAFVPQMANLELVGGVSFTKGCYPGQEIVARTQYLGTLKRRMYRGRVEAGPRPAPGTAVVSPGDAEPRGQVVEARPSPEGGYELLAVLTVAAAGGAELRLEDADGPVLTLDALPYAFPPAARPGTN